MAQRKTQQQEYPEATEGSKLAAEVRSEANALTDKEREELLKRGMQMIYGGSARACCRTGNSTMA